MTGEQSAQPDSVLALMVRTKEGEMYVIPKDALDTFRLSDEHRTEVEATLPAAGDDVEGYQYGGDWMISLRLQMAMDRYSKTLSTVSNIMKQQASTQATITSNIK